MVVEKIPSHLRYGAGKEQKIISQVPQRHFKSIYCFLLKTGLKIKQSDILAWN